MNRSLKSFLPFAKDDGDDLPPRRPTPLLLTHIDPTKSVIHAIAQDAGRRLCDAFGHGNVTDWDQWLASESGKRFQQSVREGAIHLLSKAL